MSERDPHILNAASNLLGIALVIITGLHVSGSSERTLADEIAWAAAIALALSCLLSYAGLRSPKRSGRVVEWADRVFLTGLLLLLFAVVVLALLSR